MKCVEMITDISKLTSEVAVWETLSNGASFLVWFGVLLESVAEFKILSKLFKLEEREELRHKLTKAGLSILILALAAEVPIQINIQARNGKISELQTRELNKAIFHSAELSKLTHSLELSNEELQKKLKHQEDLLVSVDARNNKFEVAIAKQKARNDDAIRALQNEETKLRAAQKEIASSSKTAATSAKIASETARNMNQALEAERKMQDRMRELITHRELSDNQKSKLAQQLRIFKNTQYDLYVNKDPDSVKLSGQLTDVLESAEWICKDAANLSHLRWKRVGKPSLGMITMAGIVIEIAESQENTLKEPAVALAKGLIANGIKVHWVGAAPDGKIDKRYDITRIHIFIGERD